MTTLLMMVHRHRHCQPASQRYTRSRRVFVTLFAHSVWNILGRGAVSLVSVVCFVANFLSFNGVLVASNLKSQCFVPFALFLTEEFVKFLGPLVPTQKKKCEWFRISVRKKSVDVVDHAHTHTHCVCGYEVCVVCIFLIFFFFYNFFFVTGLASVSRTPLTFCVGSTWRL